MTPSQRIALNTLATYSRSVLGAALALFASRWVLRALGQTDYGLFSVVGSIIVFIVFFNTVMSGSVSRHYAYAIGQGNPEEVSRWFNAALNIHIFLAVGLILIGWPIGEYVIVRYLNIPADRLQTCQWIFRISLPSAFFGIFSVPFVAMFTARQYITERAFWGLVQSAFSFGLAWGLTIIPGDALLNYAVGMASIQILIYSAFIFRAFFKFTDCRIKWGYWFDKSRLKGIFSFAVWNMISNFGTILRNHGSAILLNIYYGPQVNAAYGIANQVSVQSNQLSAAMMGAFYPEITTSEGRGDRQRMLTLSRRACKYGTLLILIIVIPLMTEMNYVLRLWLNEPPAYTALFCRLILLTFLIDRLSSGYMMAINAKGRIAAYQATIGTIMVLTLPLAWLFLHLGFAPTSVGFAFVTTMVAGSVGRMLWAWRFFGISLNRWLADVVLPCAAVAIVALTGAFVPFWLLPASFGRLIVTTFSSLAASCLVAWIYAIDLSERTYIIQNLKRAARKLNLPGYGIPKTTR